MLSFRSLRLVVLLITIVGVTAADVAVPPAYRYQLISEKDSETDGTGNELGWSDLL